LILFSWQPGVSFFAPDGRRIASTSYDGRLTIWDAAALLPPAE
jgi:WD40 repeat protein